MTILLMLLRFYRRHSFFVLLGLLLSILTLIASLFLLSLSGWFLAASAVAGVTGLTTFNYVVPAAGVRGGAILRTTARYAERLVSHNTTFKILSHLRALSFKKIIMLSPLQQQQYQKADLLNRFIADIDNLDHFYLKLLSPCITSLFGIIAIYFGLNYFNPVLAGIIVLVLLATALFLPLGFFVLSRPISRNLVHYKHAYRQQIITYLEGNTELSLFGVKASFRQKIDTIGSQWLIKQQQQARLIHLAQSVVMTLTGLLSLPVIVTGSQLHWDYHSPILALFVFMALAATELLAPLATAFIYLGEVMTSAKRLQILFSRKPAVIFPKQMQDTLCCPFDLNVSQLTFYYPGQPMPVLQNINFTIAAGRHVAIVGKTGTGKSTLVQLLTRTADPNQGIICCNNIPLSQFSESSLRRMITIVPQRIDILSDTLANNLRIAKPGATDEELLTILRQVELEKLSENKNSLSIWMGDEGRSLSGGEIRRIGIARALLSNAPCIIMDEPTESLDKETEKHMVNLIKKLGQNKTLLIITHRLIDNSLFDARYLLDEGFLKPV